MPAQDTNIIARLSAWLGTGRRAWALALLLAFLQGGLLVHTAWDKSETIDEPYYLSMAAMLWGGQGEVLQYAPVVPPWGFALTMKLFASGLEEAAAVQGDLEKADLVAERMNRLLWRKSLNELRWTLLVARFATILVVVLGGLLLWRVATRFGPVPALVTHVLWCFSPTVLANGFQAILDGWTAATLCAVIWAAVRVWESPTRGRLVLLGALGALAIPIKLTTLAGVGWAGLAGVVAAARPRAAGERFSVKRGLGAAGLMLLTGAFTLWAVLGFQVAWWHGVPVPLGRFLQTTVQAQATRVVAAFDQTYLFGKVYPGGVWWFYLACLALKLTLGAQALGLLFGAATFRRGTPWRERGLDAVLLFVPVVVLVVMSGAPHQPNISFLLPAFPFAILWAGRAFLRVGQVWGVRAQMLALLLVCVGAVEALARHPHHPMFFNLWAGGPEGGGRYLISRDDFGQDRRHLGEWQQARGIPEVYYVELNLLGSNARAWGIRPNPNVPCEPQPGVYALHAWEVHWPQKLQAGCVDWLTVEPPDERLGYSIYIWQVDEARISRLVASRERVRPFWESAYQRDARSAVTLFTAERKGNEVELRWKVRNVGLLAFASLSEQNEPSYLGSSMSDVGSMVVPANQSGVYALLGLPEYMPAIATLDGVGFRGYSPISAGAQTQLLWNVPEGPVVITDDTGAEAGRSDDRIGMLYLSPTRTTTYHLTFGTRGTATTTVEVRP